MSRPLFMFSQCSSCGQMWSVQTDWCAKCQTGQWISDEWEEQHD
jgi:uncharacterized OB-fold protein